MKTEVSIQECELNNREELRSSDERTSMRVSRMRLLKMLADRYAQDGNGMMPVRADVVSALCDAAIALDIYAEDHDALERLDAL